MLYTKDEHGKCFFYTLDTFKSFILFLVLFLLFDHVTCSEFYPTLHTNDVTHYISNGADDRLISLASAPSPMYPTPVPQNQPNKSYLILIIISVVLSSLVLISFAMTMVGFLYWKVKQARRDEEDGESALGDETEIIGIGPKKYRFMELKSATDNFNSRNELGRGGFGIVYKGTLNGEEVAVKKVSKDSKQGKKNMIAEVTTIGGLNHMNLVKLTGWCHERNELLLVYEYMPNKSLDKLLYTEEGQQHQTVLSWERRYNVLCGVAQSIDYLHNECSQRVLHRDIKTSNIMLDSEFNARLTDFGLARMFKSSEKQTHHTTYEIAGTRAYMAPESFLTGQATTHTDVYAFGVLVLEVACGRRPEIMTGNEELSYSIVDWVWESYKSGMICEVVDPRLNKNFDEEEAKCVILLGLACCHPNPRMRPSIRVALQVLMREVLPPVLPLEKPVFFWPAAAPPREDDQDPLCSGGILSDLSSSNGR